MPEFSRRTALATLAAAAVTQCAMPVMAQSRIKIRIGSALAEAFAEPYFGLDAGIFSQAGFDVEIQTFPHVQDAINACVGGALDIGMADVVQLASAVNRGVPVGFFAGGGLYSSARPTNALCVAKKGPITEPRDFVGKAIGVPGVGSLGEITTREWLRRNEVDPNSVNFVELPISAQVPALLRGTTSGCSLGEPFLTSYRDDIRVITAPYSVVADQFYIGAWFTTKDWFAKNTEIIKRFTHAVYETARWSNGNHESTAQTLAKYIKTKVEIFREMRRTSWATNLDQRNLQSVLSIASNYRVLATPMSASEMVLR